PLRSKADMLTLREAVKKGAVDCIASHHLPQNWDNKTCEFEYAKNGMISLQTAFASVLTSMNEMSAGTIAQLFSLNARKIFGLPAATIREGEEADITLFATNGENVFAKENIKSKSFNSPYIGKNLKGNVRAIFTKGKLITNK